MRRLIEGIPVVNRSQVQEMVSTHSEFQITTGNLYGYRRGGNYGVFSYDDNWPLWVFDPDANTWFTHEAEYSTTTTRHRNLSHPRWYDTIITLDGPHQLYKVFTDGYAHLVKQRIT